MHIPPRGFTVIEVILVIIIIGILATVTLRSALIVTDSARLEKTRQEMDRLAIAIAGQPDLYNAGVRADFGYVGDVGSLPPDLDALIQNPGGYSTWRGPYIANRFTQQPDDFKIDAWGSPYAYTGGVYITSTGSGEAVVRHVAASASDLLLNRVSGTVLDRDGTPPGDAYHDSLSVGLTIPDGNGGMILRTVAVDPGGFFSFDSIPIGNHDIRIVYATAADTLARFVSVAPGSDVDAVYRFGTNYWFSTSGAGGGITFVPGSDTIYSAPQCNNVLLWITNPGSAPVTISSLKLTWSSPAAYYRSVIWNGVEVADNNNPASGSGDVVAFSAPQTVAEGESVRIAVESFKESINGGQNVDMQGAVFTVELSDGSSFTISTGGCQ
jgi:prepilin-type N-terminal cleavage/methylation domain-containing protein